jgi:hypothetical protein
MIATRLNPGAISESSSSHLPASEASPTLAKPVMFPPGRSSRVTVPLATGSVTLAKTIGIVRVSRWTATVGGVEFVTMMSGCKPTNSWRSRAIRALRWLSVGRNGGALSKITLGHRFAEWATEAGFYNLPENP